MTNAIGPSDDLTPLAQAVDNTTSTALWSMEGCGKTGLVITSWPTPILIANLDRHLTEAHLFDPRTGKPLPEERKAAIFVKNLRENTMERLDQVEATQIIASVESLVERNLDWLKGGTFFIDGGTLYRTALKMADSTIAARLVAGKKMQPRDKEAINAYLAMLISHIADQGIHFVISGHAAFEWKVLSAGGDDDKASLQKTNRLYPKLDDIIFQRTNLSLFMFKRCECTRPVVNQDGSCELGVGPKHTGRKHMVRFVTNKFNTDVEGSDWEDFDFDKLKLLSFNRVAAKALMPKGN